MEETEIEKKSIAATKHHLENISKLEKGTLSEEEIGKMYDYLNYCWVCGKRFTFWARLFNMQHSFEGNSHRRCPK